MVQGVALRVDPGRIVRSAQVSTVSGHRAGEKAMSWGWPFHVGELVAQYVVFLVQCLIDGLKVCDPFEQFRSHSEALGVCDALGFGGFEG
jgi:hypothetical protein